MFKDIFSDFINEKIDDAQEDIISFPQEHPIMTGLMCVMGAVIFAQHVELKCLTAARSQTVFVL